MTDETNKVELEDLQHCFEQVEIARMARGGAIDLSSPIAKERLAMALLLLHDFERQGRETPSIDAQSCLLMFKFADALGCRAELDELITRFPPMYIVERGKVLVKFDKLERGRVESITDGEMTIRVEPPARLVTDEDV